MLNTAAPKVARVKAWRAGSVEVVHVGFLTDIDNDGITPLYRLACQGRNARYLMRAEDDQTIRVTCQKCKGRVKE